MARSALNASSVISGANLTLVTLAKGEENSPVQDIRAYIHSFPRCMQMNDFQLAEHFPIN